MKPFFYKLLKLDEKASKRLALEHPPQAIEFFFKLISHSCDSWYWLVGLVALWILSKPSGKEIAVTFSFVLGFLAIVVLLIKYFFKRARPEGDWGQIYRINDPHSFPSGHAARAMAIVIISISFFSGWAVLLILVWALLVGYSRVALKVHYLSDVLVGFLFGAVFAFASLSVFNVLIDNFPKIARFLFHGF